MPTLNLGANTGRAFSNNPALEGRTYALTLGFSFPLFTGYARELDLMAAQELAAEFGIPVVAIARLDELLALAAERPELAPHRARLEAYRTAHGCDD